MSQAKSWLVNPGLFLLSGLLCVVVAEQLLRLIDYQHNPLNIEIRIPNRDRLQHVFEDVYFVYDPRLIWRPKPDLEPFNSQGFRGPVLADIKAPGEYRIFALGDSNTLGWRGSTSAHWPGDLDRLMRQHGDGFKVVNAGVYGYTSFQGLQRFRECLAYDPNLVLISFGANDGHRVRSADRDYAQDPTVDGNLNVWLQHYRLGQMLLATRSRLFAGLGQELQPRVSLEEYRRNLGEIIRLAGEQGIIVILLTRPYTGRISDEGQWKNFAHEYNLVTAEIAVNEKVPLVDIYSHFKGQFDYFADESHLTAAGHRRVGEVIYETLRLVVLQDTS